MASFPSGVANVSYSYVKSNSSGPVSVATLFVSSLVNGSSGFVVFVYYFLSIVDLSGLSVVCLFRVVYGWCFALRVYVVFGVVWGVFLACLCVRDVWDSCVGRVGGGRCWALRSVWLIVFGD